MLPINFCQVAVPHKDKGSCSESVPEFLKEPIGIIVAGRSRVDSHGDIHIICLCFDP